MIVDSVRPRGESCGIDMACIACCHTKRGNVGCWLSQRAGHRSVMTGHTTSWCDSRVVEAGAQKCGGAGMA